MYNGIVLVCNREIDHDNKRLLIQIIYRFRNFNFCLVRNFMTDEELDLKLNNPSTDRLLEIDIKRPKDYKFAVKMGIRALTQKSRLKFAAHTEFEPGLNSQWILDALDKLERDEAPAIEILETKPANRYFEKLSFRLQDLLR